MHDEEVDSNTRIVATLGPATDDADVLAAMLINGVDIVRLNLSHGSHDEHRKRAETVRELARTMGHDVAILMDLQGPKIRIGTFADGPVELVEDDPFTLDCTAAAAPGTERRVGVSYDGLPDDVEVGDVLLLDDGLLALRVVQIDGCHVHCVVKTGGTLSDRKGLNRLGGGLSLDVLSVKDRADIVFAAKLQADFVAVSFVGSGRDMDLARRLLAEAGSDAALVAKIERAEAIEALGDIIDASDAVMVARGDLGVEVGYPRLPGLQKRIIHEAVSRRRSVITATQMLQSMVSAPIPTRAETLDVANAVIDGTDAVMLSAESAAGNHPVDAVKVMRRICVGAERELLPEDQPSARTGTMGRGDQAIAEAAMFLARRLRVDAIVTLTESGTTARLLSRHRSPIPIFALSPSDRARRRMLLLRGVTPVPFTHTGADPGRVVRLAVKQLFDDRRLLEGQRVIFTHGDDVGRGGITNTLRLLRVGAEGSVESLKDL